MSISRVYSSQRALLGGPDVVPSPNYAIATIMFKSRAEMDAEMLKFDTAVNHMPNFTNTKPVMVTGEAVS